MEGDAPAIAKSGSDEEQKSGVDGRFGIFISALLHFRSS
jgi:hypothetical protein